MDGLVFEKYLVELLRGRGYTNLELTERYDYGVDIIATKDDVRWGIQAKRYSNLVKAEAVRQVVTALNKYNCQRSMVITNSTFSRPARLLAESNSCILVDRTTMKRERKRRTRVGAPMCASRMTSSSVMVCEI